MPQGSSCGGQYTLDAQQGREQAEASPGIAETHVTHFCSKVLAAQQFSKGMDAGSPSLAGRC